MARNLWLLGAVALALLTSRLITMMWLPMADTTEPRYAEIARLMMASGDWITPWFEPGVPFWGKPPLSFWMQALSLKLFGASDFAARLPAWIATLGIVVLTARLAWQLGGARLAAISALVLSTMALSWIAAGAVMTDTFLVLGTTLSLVAFMLSAHGAHRLWGWLFFIGIAIGLLAKGPLTLVLVGVPIVAWSLWNLRWRAPWSVVPWRGGSLLTAALVLPWYIAAEIKTPGFFNYFIIGEHFGRFIVSGWAGDLYGSAHHEPRGMIWLFLLWASFPWGLIGAALLLRELTVHSARSTLRQWLAQPAHGLILAALLTTPAFFTLSGNILWTYLLPSLPFAAVLIAFGLQRIAVARLSAAAVLVPLVVTALGLYLAQQPEQLKSEEPLLAAFHEHRPDKSALLRYVGGAPHSARYYGGSTVVSVTREEVPALIGRNRDEVLFVALRHEEVERFAETLEGAETLFRGRRYTLLQIVPAAHSDNDALVRAQPQS